MIVVNCRFLAQNVTGVQRFAEEVTTALLELRSDVVLLAPPGEIRTERIGNSRVQQVGTRRGHLWEQWDLPCALSQIPGKPVLLSLMNTGPVFHRKQAVTHHDVTYVRHPQTYSARFRHTYRLLSWLTLHSARAVLTVSDFSRREISDVYRLPPGKLTVVPNAASQSFHQLAGREEQPAYFLAVSSLLPHKNLELLVRSFQRYAAESGTETRLKLVGGPPKGIAGKNGPRHASTCVDYLGRVNDEQLRTLYSRARAFVFPSLYEGFGIPPLEAQASGVPVLASDADALREVLGRSALYFVKDSEDSLLSGIRELDTDPDLRQELRGLGDQNVLKYSWKRSAAMVNEVLNRVDEERWA